MFAITPGAEARRKRESYGPCQPSCHTATRHWGDMPALLLIAALGISGLATGQNGIISTTAAIGISGLATGQNGILSTTAALGISGLATGQNDIISTAAFGIRGLATDQNDIISTAALGIRGLATGHRNISRNSGASPHSVMFMSNMSAVMSWKYHDIWINALWRQLNTQKHIYSLRAVIGACLE